MKLLKESGREFLKLLACITGAKNFMKWYKKSSAIISHSMDGFLLEVKDFSSIQQEVILLEMINRQPSSHILCQVEEKYKVIMTSIKF